MSTSDTDGRQGARRPVRRSSIKTAIAYLAVSLLCVAVANVYALFGHGIRSDSMDLMFLYPLLGGAVLFLLVALVAPRLPERLQKASRVGYNLYNSGIACLTSAALLTGIMEIAGTGSKGIPYIQAFGIVFLAAAAAFQAVSLFKRGG